MKKIILFIFLALSFNPFNLSAQNNEQDFDVRFGISRTILGTGDMSTLGFDTELNYRINPYLTASTSVGYGKSTGGIFLTTSYLQGNFNVFVSPLKNIKINDFRVGTGLSVMSVSDVYIGMIFTDGFQREIIEYDDRTTVGFNIMIENTYAINDKYLIGAKIFTQPYLNGDINSGILIKFGVRI